MSQELQPSDLCVIVTASSRFQYARQFKGTDGMTAERRKMILAMRQLWLAKREVYRAIAEVEAKLYPQPPALLRKQAN